MNTTNKIIHGLWIGPALSAMEMLTIKSFIDNGHEFYLWVYEEPDSPLPEGTVIQDANKILPEQHVFQYQSKCDLTHGVNSYAGYSDIFRYKLLYEVGGWWADMDVTCLKPLDFEEPYVFRDFVFRHSYDLAVVGNLMKCPQGSPLMKDCFEVAINEVTKENTEWLKPVMILNEQIDKHQLAGFIKHHIVNPELWELVDMYRYFPVNVPKEYYVIHWLNEHYRNQAIDKNQVVKQSLLDRLMQTHGVEVSRVGFADSVMTSRYI